MHRLIVKGNRFEAAQAAADRGIPFVFIRELEDVTVGAVGAQFDDLVTAWFHEDGRAPYPAGSLLSFARDFEGPGPA